MIFLRPRGVVHKNHSRLVQDITFLGGITLIYTTDPAKLTAQKFDNFLSDSDLHVTIVCAVASKYMECIEILMYLLLYTCSFCCLSCSGDTIIWLSKLTGHCVLGDKLRIYCRHLPMAATEN